MAEVVAEGRARMNRAGSEGVNFKLESACDQTHHVGEDRVSARYL